MTTVPYAASGEGEGSWRGSGLGVMLDRKRLWSEEEPCCRAPWRSFRRLLRSGGAQVESHPFHVAPHASPPTPKCPPHAPPWLRLRVAGWVHGDRMHGREVSNLRASPRRGDAPLAGGPDCARGMVASCCNPAQRRARRLRRHARPYSWHRWVIPMGWEPGNRAASVNSYPDAAVQVDYHQAHQRSVGYLWCAGVATRVPRSNHPG